MKKIDLTNKRFGRLVVIKEGAKSNSHRVRWICQCDCGKEAIVLSSGLITGGTKSCGCLHKEMFSNRKHGASGKDHIAHFEYGIYRRMKRRCCDPKIKDYKNYGGRGIKVCERWMNSFDNFIEDMGLRPTRNHSLERKYNDGDYSPLNCVWATKREQNRNTRKNVWIEFRGEKRIISDWISILKTSYNTIKMNVLMGKSYDQIFSEAAKRNNIKEYINFIK